MNKERKYNRSMRRIIADFTGNTRKDIVYLEKIFKKYKDRKLSKKIRKTCGHLYYELICDETRIKAIPIYSDMVEMELKMARLTFHIKKYDEVQERLEKLLQKVEDRKLYVDDQVNEYRFFEEPFEEKMYRHIYHPDKVLHRAKIPYTQMYLLYGSALMKLQYIDEAQKALRKGLHWNPVCFDLMSQYIETFKIKGDMDTFFKKTIDAFKIAYRPLTVAKCYSNLGFYFAERQLYSEAKACYLLSGKFTDSQQLQLAVDDIDSTTEGKIKAPSMEDIRSYAVKYGFPMSVDEEIVNLSYSLGKHFMKAENVNQTRYFFGIFYEITRDAKIKKILDQLPTLEIN